MTNPKQQKQTSTAANIFHGNVRIAAGFLRNNGTSDEGGAIYRIDPDAPGFDCQGC